MLSYSIVHFEVPTVLASRHVHPNDHTSAGGSISPLHITSGAVHRNAPPLFVRPLVKSPASTHKASPKSAIRILPSSSNNMFAYIKIQISLGWVHRDQGPDVPPEDLHAPLDRRGDISDPRRAGKSSERFNVRTGSASTSPSNPYPGVLHAESRVCMIQPRCQASSLHPGRNEIIVCDPRVHVAEHAQERKDKGMAHLPPRQCFPQETLYVGLA